MQIATQTGFAPVNNVLQHNTVTDLQTQALFFIKLSGANDIGFNVASSGPTTLAGSASAHFESVNGIRFYHNTLLNLLGNTTTIDVASADVTNTQIFMNRMIATSPYYQFSTPGNTAVWDAGAVLGGNYWAGFSANGNPSNGTTPFTRFNNGSATDRYPYKDETYGMSYAVQVAQPANGAVVAAGSQKTIAWNSAACVYVDIGYKRSGGSLSYIVQNYPDGGIITGRCRGIWQRDRTIR